MVSVGKITNNPQISMAYKVYFLLILGVQCRLVMVLFLICFHSETLQRLKKQPLSGIILISCRGMGKKRT